MAREQETRISNFVLMQNKNGSRSGIRLGAIPCLSDTSQMGVETVIQHGGRQFVIDTPLDRVRGWLQGRL